MSAPHILHIFSTFAPAGPELRAVSLIHATGEAYRHSILAIDGRTDAMEMPANTTAGRNPDRRKSPPAMGRTAHADIAAPRL